MKPKKLFYNLHKTWTLNPWQNLKPFKGFMRIKYSWSLELIKMQTNYRNFTLETHKRKTLLNWII